jgi:NCAIR mutase (PurE)-related protein
LAMDPERIKIMLAEVGRGERSVDDAFRELKELPFRSLGFARPDTHRHLRTGFPEVVFGQGKTPEQIAAILIELTRGGSVAFATRVTPDAAAIVLAMLQAAGVPDVRHLPIPRVLVVGAAPPQTRGRGIIAVISAGTADVPVAEEAALTAELAGHRVARIYDAGVAGIHRLLAERETIERAELLIVVAGMEGALPSVVAGLFARPVIAVPTSVGYGANLGGFAALLSMLNACAPGIAVVNIDNGFGAGQMAAMLNRRQDG